MSLTLSYLRFIQLLESVGMGDWQMPPIQKISMSNLGEPVNNTLIWKCILSGKARWLAKGLLEEMPHINDSNSHEGTTLSESTICAIHMYYFPPNKHLTCFTASCLFMRIYFYKAARSRPCHWLLVLEVEWLGLSTLLLWPEFNLHSAIKFIWVGFYFSYYIFSVL